MKPEDRKRILEKFSQTPFFEAFDDFVNEKINEIKSEAVEESDDFSEVVGARIAIEKLRSIVGYLKRISQDKKEIKNDYR